MLTNLELFHERRFDKLKVVAVNICHINSHNLEFVVTMQAVNDSKNTDINVEHCYFARKYCKYHKTVCCKYDGFYDECKLKQLLSTELVARTISKIFIALQKVDENLLHCCLYGGP